MILSDIKLNNGVVMPTIGLGVYKMEDISTTENLIIDALKFGYKSIDTAAIYNNEKSVGNAIKKSGIPRKDIFLTSKVWNDDLRQKNTLKAFDESLKKLDTDYLDLYLIHWPVEGYYIQGYKDLEEIYKSGRVKSIGVSNFHIHHLKDLFENTYVIPVVNQIEIHPYLAQEELIQFCLAHDITPEAWSPLGAGLKELFIDPTIVEISNLHKKTTAQVILRWHLQRKTIIIPKSSNLERIKENSNILDFNLTLEEMTSITNLNRGKHQGPDPDNFNF